MLLAAIEFFGAFNTQRSGYVSAAISAGNDILNIFWFLFGIDGFIMPELFLKHPEQEPDDQVTVS